MANKITKSVSSSNFDLEKQKKFKFKNNLQKTVQVPSVIT